MVQTFENYISVIKHILHLFSILGELATYSCAEVGPRQDSTLSKNLEKAIRFNANITYFYEKNRDGE